jgi:hypothetical protein
LVSAIWVSQITNVKIFSKKNEETSLPFQRNGDQEFLQNIIQQFKGFDGEKTRPPIVHFKG